MSAPITEAHDALIDALSWAGTTRAQKRQLIADSEARAKQEEAALWKVSVNAANTALVNMTTAWKNGVAERDQLRTEVEQRTILERARTDEARAERDQLRTENKLLRAAQKISEDTDEQTVKEMLTLRAEVERLTKDRDDWKAKHWKAHDDFQRIFETSLELSTRAEKAEAELAAAKELLREIRDHEVNEADEADKFLRDHIPSELSKVRVELATERARLRGLATAQLAIESFIVEARAACQPYGPRQGKTLKWWRGNFEGLVAAKSMLALADFPNHPDNAKQIAAAMKEGAT